MLKKTASLHHIALSLFATVMLLGTESSALAQCACGGSTAGTAYTIPSSVGVPANMLGVPAGVTMGQVIEGDTVYLTVNVPELAILKVNGDPTISVGTTRYFVVKELEPGREYKFVIVAETANAAGVAMEETKTVTVKPGNIETVTLKPVKRKVIAPLVVDDNAAEAAGAAANAATNNVT